MVWYSNGVYVFLILPLEKWPHVIVTADATKGIVQAYVDKKLAGRVYSDPFKFDPAILTIGKLSKTDDMYFKGTVDELEIWNKSIGSD